MRPEAPGIRTRAPNPKTKNLGPCCIGDCTNKSVVREMCPMHYARWRKHGDASVVKQPDRKKAARRGFAHHAFGGVHIGYGSAHCRVQQMWGSAKSYRCITCDGPAASWAYDGTDPEQRYEQYRGRWCFYSPWPEFYAPMCAKCHLGRDKRLAQQELYEYRMWKHKTGKTLADLGEIQ